MNNGLHTQGEASSIKGGKYRSRRCRSLMVLDPGQAATLVAPGCAVTFPCGRVSGDPRDPTTFDARRYKRVKKRPERVDVAAAVDGTGVCTPGFPYEEWPRGTPFASRRCVDWSEVKEWRIMKMNVWNSSAEWILDPALRRW